MNDRLRSERLVLGIAYAGFISLGLPDTLIGVAWPSVRDSFQVSQSAAALIFIGTGSSYFLSSLFTGRLLSVVGIGTLLAASSALVALSGFGFGLAPLWLLFAGCSLLHGLGSGAIDGGLNHYVAHHFSARHMNWLHACYSLGATLGPLIMTGAIVRAASWRAGYVTVALVLLALALLFTATRRQWDRAEEKETGVEPAAAETVGLGKALGHPLVLLHALIFFVYTGLEVTVGQWSFTVLKEARGISDETAGLWVTFYWGSIGVGRVLFGFIVERLGIDRLVRLSAAAAIAGTGLFALNVSGVISAIALILTGLGLASIFPSLMTRTPQRLGKALAVHAIGIQVSAAMLGAAALPSLSGILAEAVGLESIATAAVAMAAVLWLVHEGVLVRARKR